MNSIPLVTYRPSESALPVIGPAAHALMRSLANATWLRWTYTRNQYLCRLAECDLSDPRTQDACRKFTAMEDSMNDWHDAMVSQGYMVSRHRSN